MRELFILVAHLLATLAKLMRPGGVRAVVAESLLLKHQLLILKRSRNRAPNFTPWDRLLLGLVSLVVRPQRIAKIAIALKPATLMRFHQALTKLKYHLLFASRRQRRPGPKGPSLELIAAIVEMKRRNPRFGCPRIALGLRTPLASRSTKTSSAGCSRSTIDQSQERLVRPG
jgi:hypothetical protein